MNEKEQKEELTQEELERQNGEPLPDRTQMSVLRTDLTSPIFVGGDEMLPAPGPAPTDS
jgi:hypothetical protein